MISFQQIRAFVYVAECSSFTLAARRLEVTQPAVSAQIRTLEESLGLRLMARKGRRIALTREGRFFFPQAKKLLQLFDQTWSALEQFRGLEQGRVTVAASTIPGEYLLPRLIGAFKQLYPGLEIELFIGDSSEAAKYLAEYQVELAIAGAPLESAEINCNPLATDELVFLAPPQPLLPLPSSLTLTELKKLPFVMREQGSGTRKAIETVFAEHGLEPQQLSTVMHLGSTRAVISAVEAGLGVSLVSRWAAEESLALGRVREFSVQKLQVRRNLYLLTRSDGALSQAATAFQHFLLEQGRSLLGDNPLAANSAAKCSGGSEPPEAESH